MFNTDNWTQVIHSKKVRCELKQQEDMECEKSARYERYSKISLPEGPFVDTEGFPLIGITSTWPELSKCTDLLLSEEFKTTEPVQISCLDKYFSKELKQFIAKFTVPIYHISYAYEHDMCYDRKGHRTPVSYIIRIYIWTYHMSHPIVHVYDAYKMQHIKYSTSISPFIELECDGEEEWWDMDVALRFMELLE